MSVARVQSRSLAQAYAVPDAEFPDHENATQGPGPEIYLPLDQNQNHSREQPHVRGGLIGAEFGWESIHNLPAESETSL